MAETSKQYLLFIGVALLSGCAQSDVERCVKANLDAYDQGTSHLADENEGRTEFKARVELICAKYNSGG